VGTVVTNSMSVGGDCTTGLVVAAELACAVEGIWRILGFRFKSLDLDDMQAGDLPVMCTSHDSTIAGPAVVRK
jgi:hypothetical protein